MFMSAYNVSMTVRGPLERAVRSAVRAQQLTPADRAAVELAATYARRIDAGQDLEYRTARLLDRVADLDAELADEVDRLRVATSMANTTATFGPKLLAALDALALTPRARAAITKGVTGDKPAADPIDELRARRAARQHHAPAVDPASS
jgi:hypothetical protein